MIESHGDLGVECINDANVPVCIWFHGPEHRWNTTGQWSLRASNYMPRKEKVVEGAYIFTADTKEELSELVEKHILPLYVKATDILRQMVAGKLTNLFYWSEPL